VIVLTDHDVIVKTAVFKLCPYISFDSVLIFCIQYNEEISNAIGEYAVYIQINAISGIILTRHWKNTIVQYYESMMSRKFQNVPSISASSWVRPSTSTRCLFNSTKMTDTPSNEKV
jgi:hypothetical protein